jgi:hypothetical protein
METRRATVALRLGLSAQAVEQMPDSELEQWEEYLSSARWNGPELVDGRPSRVAVFIAGAFVGAFTVVAALVLYSLGR